MKDKVLIIQRAGEHLLNREFRESLSIKRAFDRLGIESTVWGKGYPTFIIPFEQIIKGFNIILIVENYDFDWIPNLEKFNGTKVFWSIDGHLVIDKHKEFFRAVGGVEIVLNSNMNCVALWKEYKCESLWFPNCYDDDLITNKKDIKKLNRMGFCGSSHEKRDEVVNKLDKKLKEFNFEIKRDNLVIGDNMVNAINSYMIHFNMNIAEDINYRTFETMGCKTMLFTNHTSGIDLLFDCDKELLLWSTEDDLYSNAIEFVNNIQKSMVIANAGYERVKKDHTYFVRMKHLIDAINQ